MIGSVKTGGRAEAFAFIVVTYPVGSTCTCTCTETGKVLRAKVTSGSWVFDIPYAETWTVACTDGIRTAYKYVTIIEEGIATYVTIGYELVLYDSINGWNMEYASFVSKSCGRDWGASTHTAGIPSVSYSESGNRGIVEILASNTNYSGGLFINNIAIDVTDYSTLALYGTASPNGGGYLHTILYDNNAPQYTRPQFGILAELSYLDTSEIYTNIKMNIAGVIGNAYIGISPCKNTGRAYYRLNKIVLES